MSSKIRLVVSDVDGTLVNSDKELTEETVAAVAELRDAGIGFTIISARPRSGMMPIAERLDLDGAMGAFNGGLIFKRDGTVLEHHRIEPGIAAGIWDIIGDADVDRWVFADDKWHASNGTGLHARRERISSNQQPVITGDFSEVIERADKITFVSDDENLLRGLHEKIKPPYGDKATIVQSQTYYLDVTALEANKGAGIERLSAAMDTPMDSIAAFGDQANDLPMLQRAGVSVAMGNGAEAIREFAQHISRSNDEDGAAYAIRTIILGGKDR